MSNLYTELLRLATAGEEGAVATIVRTKGSTPREVGARMIISASGSTQGTIGGGCGEAEVWGYAMEVIESGTPQLVEVDLLHDLDAEGGRACGGIMYVFVEPIPRLLDGCVQSVTQSTTSVDGNE